MKNIIEVKNLVKNYGDVHAVKNISFSVEEGSFFAFLGINGAGKSTTINILCTALEKTSGEVFICSHDLEKEKTLIKNEIGIVFQGSVLDKELSVMENLLVRASLYGKTKKEILPKLNEIIERLELKEILHRKYKNLSGGQRRRVDIARALINDPKILFLDEPTTGLDPQTRVMVWKTISDLRKEKNLTVFLTTHYMEETASADKVIIIDQGEIVAEGSPLELKTKYAHDSLIWYTEQKEELDKLILESSLSFKYNKTAYIIKIKNSFECSEFISKNKDILLNYEVKKGDMDDVFLNVTGKKLGE